MASEELLRERGLFLSEKNINVDLPRVGKFANLPVPIWLAQQEDENRRMETA